MEPGLVRQRWTRVDKHNTGSWWQHVFWQHCTRNPMLGFGQVLGAGCGTQHSEQNPSMGFNGHCTLLLWLVLLCRHAILLSQPSLLLLSGHKTKLCYSLTLPSRRAICVSCTSRDL
jgi:hypothetical protein